MIQDPNVPECMIEVDAYRLQDLLDNLTKAQSACPNSERGVVIRKIMSESITLIQELLAEVPGTIGDKRCCLAGCSQCDSDAAKQEEYYSCLFSMEEYYQEEDED